MKTFAYHKPSEEGMRRITDLREAFSETLSAMKANCPESRELSVAVTNLETAAMWAVKAVVHNDAESEVAT